MAVFQRFKVTPDVVRAGEADVFTLNVVFGQDVSPKPFEVVFDFPATLGTSRPTLLHQEAEGFVRAFCDNPDVAWTLRL